MRSHASAMVVAGCFSKDARIKSRSAAISLTGRLRFHCRRPSKPPLPKRGHVLLDGGPTDSDSLGRLLTREPGVQQPKHEHLFADSEVRMTASFLVDDALLFLGQLHAKPGHGVPPCVMSQSG